MHKFDSFIGEGDVQEIMMSHIQNNDTIDSYSFYYYIYIYI